MIDRTDFHIDCTPVIPECGFKCAKCLQEIHSVLTKMQGVERSYLEGEGENTKLIVEYDSSKVTVEHLIETFGRLPSFYKGFFVAELLDA